MTRSVIDLRRLATFAAVLLVLPAAVFFAAAIGRSLQPVEHEPARTLEAIVEAFAAMPPALGIALVVVAPLVALCLAAFVVARTFDADERLRGDLRAAGIALMPIVRRPTLVVAAVVLVGSLAILAFLALHAVAG
jgi:hypothetical protein